MFDPTLVLARARRDLAARRLVVASLLVREARRLMSLAHARAAADRRRNDVVAPDHGERLTDAPATPPAGIRYPR